MLTLLCRIVRLNPVAVKRYTDVAVLSWTVLLVVKLRGSGVSKDQVVPNAVFLCHLSMRCIMVYTHIQGSVAESPSLLKLRSLDLPGAQSPLYQPGIVITYGSLIVIL